MDYRTETDSHGEVSVPAEAYYGAQTARALTNFPIGEDCMPSLLIHALGLVGCALADVGQVDRTLPILKKAIEANPQNRHAKTALALAQLARGELKDALEAAADACKEDDRIYLPRLALAAVHLVRKDQVNAVAAVRECVRTKPDLNREEVTCFVGERLGAGVWAIAQARTDRRAQGEGEYICLTTLDPRG